MTDHRHLPFSITNSMALLGSCRSLQKPSTSIPTRASSSKLLNMGLSKKRKQQLAHITARSIEIRKRRKVDRENQQKDEILRREREEEDRLEEDLLDETGNLRSISNSLELNCDGSSQDGTSTEKDNLVVENKGGDGTCDGLGNHDGGVQLRAEEQTFKPTWRGDAGGYLRGVRGCGSSATKKRERRREKDLEKSASQTRSNVEIFSDQLVKE